MNKRCYRVIFNTTRGLLMTVAEIVPSHGKSGGKSARCKVASASKQGGASGALVFGAWAALGLVIVPAATVQAQMVADPSAPGNQRPTVLAAPNGVPIANIQTPSKAGVSRNTYQQFDVEAQGAILNNSRSNTQSQLGGWVQGNPWLAAGSAKVILNEVNSSSPSRLGGYVEVAGQRAEVVIANPAGINVDGGGFINASRATLTTGTPLVNNGNLDGYQVRSGQISINGAGLDGSVADYTDLIARSVVVNAGIWANQLKVTAGANQVDVGNATAVPIAGTGAAPAVAIDTAQLGGMYAGKIALVGTEAGVGVRNAGNIGAAAGELVVTAEGRLENSGRITGAGNLQIDSTEGIANSGTLYSQADASLTTRGHIDNSGTIAAQGNTSLAATGADSVVTSTAASALGAGVQSDGSLGDSGTLSVQATQQVVAQGKNLAGGDLRMGGRSLKLAGSTTSAKNLNLGATVGDLDLSGASVAISRSLTASAGKTLRTDSAKVSAAQLTLSAYDLSNVLGEIVQIGSGDFSLTLPGSLDNTKGRIAGNSRNFKLGASTITNVDGRLEHAGDGTFSLAATTIKGRNGRIGSNGLLDLKATSTVLDGGETVARQLRLDSATLSNRGGLLAQSGTGAATLAAATLFDNTGGRLLSNGAAALTVGDLLNQGGTIQAAGDTSSLSIAATGRLDNRNAGTMAAGGATGITAKTLDNSQGRITAGLGLHIDVTQGLGNTQGLIAANNGVTLAAAEIDNTRGTIGSVRNGVNLTADTGVLTNSFGRIEAAEALSLSALGLTNSDGTILGSSLALNSQTRAFDNTRGTIVATGSTNTGGLQIDSGALTNTAGLIQAKGLLAIDTHGQSLRNAQSGTSGGIIGQAGMRLLTRDLDNSTGYIGGKGAIDITGASITNAGGGTIIGQDVLRVNAAGLDNRGGQFQVAGDLSLRLSGTLDNTASLLRAGKVLTVTADSIVNASTLGANQGMEAEDIFLTAATLNNRSGAVRADRDATFTGSGSLDNTGGWISAVRNAALLDKAVSKALAILNSGGTLIAGKLLTVESAGLSGDGSLLSQGDLRVRLSRDYSHAGKLQAKGDLDFATAGSFANASTVEAGKELRIQAATLDNAKDGIFSAGTTNLIASSALTNRGLIDGGNTWVAAATLNNLGTGRIYGDHVAIAATTLNNDVENGIAPVIAARERLDIGATTINNREHALLFSVGDLAIGGWLDANHLAAGQGGTLSNASATIESLGNMALSVGQINNTNEHFSTRVDSLPEQTIHDYVGGGSPYVANPPEVAVVFVGGAGRRYLHTPGGDFYSYYQRDYVRTATETRVAESDPAQILAGGSITFTAGNLLNDKSHIIAGGAISGSLGSLTNTEVAGERVITDIGRIGYFCPHKDHTNNPDNGENGGWQSYTPAPVTQTFNLAPTVFQQNATPTGTGTQIGTLSTVTVTTTPGIVGSVGTSRNGQVVTPITQVPAVNGNTAGGPGMVIRSGGINTQVPNNSLFAVRPGPGSRYLVETDPRFTNFRQWLSSDYLIKAMKSDPATQKRLGDGFYEQKVVREQIAQLTGRRFLEGYADDEAQYLALMHNAATFAQAANLRPGVALSAAQMAQLTSDIVWLVAQSVTLADGSTTQVLAPQVYARVQDGDLQTSGALIAGDSINLRLSGDLSNSGTIAGRKAVALTAENVQNLGGRIQGNEVAVRARTDLNNLGGTIAARSSLSAIAGRDLNVTTTTSSSVSNQGSRTNLDRVAGLYLTGGSGNLIAAAGHDLTLTGAVVANQGTGATVLSAGHNLNLDTVRESFQQAIVWDSSNFRKEASHTDIGTAVRTVGDLRLNAGNDLNLKAANVTSELGALVATAGNNINLTTGEAFSYYDGAHRSKSKGLFSSTTTTSRDTLNQTLALGTTLSGETATVFAGRDLNVWGGNIVSTGGTTLIAGQDINLLAAINTGQESHFRSEKKSGLLSSGGVGFTIGSRQQSTDQHGEQTTASASTVGSIEGDVRIQAGRNYTQVGSNVVAPVGDIDIEAQRVSIMEARETSRTTTETKTKQSGVTLGVTNPVLSAVQTGQQMWSAAQDTKDTRMRALAAASTVLAASNAFDAVKTGQGITINGKEHQIPTKLDADGKPIEGRDATTADRVGGVNVSLSFGTSKGQSKTTQTSDTAAGSTVAAGRDVRIRATGAGADSDLIVQGSTITGGRNVNLLADDEIRLLAAQNLADQHSTNKNSSASIGISYGSDGLLLNAGASGGRGKADGSDTLYTNTQVEAGNQLTLHSGGDTTLRGAVAAGRQVTADVGGDLNIESLQDSSTYASKQQSLGGSVSVGAGTMSGSVSASKSTINSNFQSVGEQSGLKAGDEGFDVKVKGNTDLKGAVIASTDQAVAEGKNRFTTSGLSMSDIENKAEYDAKGAGVNVGSGWSPGGKLTPQGTSGGVGEDSGSAASTTKSGISGIAGNREVRTGDAETGIKPIFDADKVQKEIDAQVAITQQFGQLASKAVGDYAGSQMKAGQAKRDEAGRLPDGDPRKAELEQQAKALEDQWGEHGTLRLAAHTLVGGLTGGTSGAAGAAAGTLTTPVVAEQLAKAGVAPELAQVLIAAAGTTVGAATGGTTGAAAALNEVANNYLNSYEKAMSRYFKKLQVEHPELCQEFCQNEIVRIEEMDKKRDKDYQAASDECNTTGKCNKLIDLNKQMYEVMDWKGELSKDYESKHPNQTNGRWDEKQKRWVPPKDDNGGLSFSAYQIQAGKPTVEKSYEKSTMKDFMAYLQVTGLDAYKALQDAGGVEAAWRGDDKFVQAWKKLSGGTDFVRYQEEFIEQKKFAPSYRYAGKIVPDLEDRSKVLDEIIWSGAVQHGAGKSNGKDGNNKIVKNAWTGKSDASDEQLVRDYYDARIARYPDYAKRYKAEMNTALDMLKKSK